jgi:hypothetical protein
MSTTNTGMNTGSGWMETFTGKSIPAQIVLALTAALVLFIVLFSVETLIKTFNKYKGAKTFLVENTLLSNSARVVRQNPADRTSKLILPSDNELTGVEFTYSFFLYVEPATINTVDTEVILKQVFYKGYSQPFPLLGPGVFIKGNTNSMRVFMNSYKNWYSYVDIDNIPLQKWFHIALVFRSNSLEVYINGNLKGRIDMTDTYPYQNYQDIIIFGGTPYPGGGGTIRSFSRTAGEPAERFRVGGPMSGQISRLAHYRYALSFAEIQANVNEGPSSKVERSGDETYYNPNTLKDTWWTSGQ